MKYVYITSVMINISVGSYSHSDQNKHSLNRLDVYHSQQQSHLHRTLHTFDHQVEQPQVHLRDTTLKQDTSATVQLSLRGLLCNQSKQILFGSRQNLLSFSVSALRWCCRVRAHQGRAVSFQCRWGADSTRSDLPFQGRPRHWGKRFVGFAYWLIDWQHSERRQPALNQSKLLQLN